MWGEYKSFVFQARRAEIDEQAAVTGRGFEIVDDYGVMGGIKGRNGLQCDNHFIKADKNRPKMSDQAYAGVVNRQRCFANKWYIAACELNRERLLIHRLQETSSQLCMTCHARADDRKGLRIAFGRIFICENLRHLRTLSATVPKPRQSKPHHAVAGDFADVPRDPTHFCAIRGKRFTRCTIVGPAVIAPMSCKMLGIEMQSMSPADELVQGVLWVVKEGEYKIGAILCDHCEFYDCELMGIGLAQTPEQAEKTKSVMKSDTRLGTVRHQPVD